MCQVNNKRIYPEKDIICYKVVVKDPNDTFYSFYQGMVLLVNKILIAKGLHHPRHPLEIYGGMFHSYKYKKDTKRMKKFCGGVLIKCKIPKNTLIYEGLFGISKSYSSRMIEILGEI